MYQRFDVRGRRGRVSFRREVVQALLPAPMFRIYRKRSGDSTFVITDEFLPHELVPFMVNLARAQNTIPAGKVGPVSYLEFEDVYELYEQAKVASEALKGALSPVWLMRAVLRRCGQRMIAGTDSQL